MRDQCNAHRGTHTDAPINSTQSPTLVLYVPTRLISPSSHHLRHAIIFYRGHTEQCCLPTVYLHHTLYACVVAAFIFVPYWPHPHLDISFPPITFTPRRLNTAVRQHFTNICPSYVAYVSAATLRWAVPVYWQLKKFLSFFLPLTQTCTDTVTRAKHTHKHKVTSICLASPSQLVICAKALGGGKWGVSSDLIPGGLNAWFLLTLILSLHPSWKSFLLLCLQLWRMIL